jgi:hypothetical protein
MSYGQTVTHVTASQASSGADTAAKLLNQVNSNSQYTSFGRKPVAAPKSVAVISPAQGATELMKLQGEWNELCNMFGWKGKGGKSRTRTKGRSLARRHPPKKSRPRTRRRHISKRGGVMVVTRRRG